jgi:hypothetical protein
MQEYNSKQQNINLGENDAGPTTIWTTNTSI